MRERERKNNDDDDDDTLLQMNKDLSTSQLFTNLSLNLITNTESIQQNTLLKMK